jgi:hypothetical protein
MKIRPPTSISRFSSWNLTYITSVGYRYYWRKLILIAHKCIAYFGSLHVWQYKTKHIIITDNKFITTYVILSFTLSHHIHNIGIYMSNKHSHTLLIHMTNTHSLIKSIHIVSYTYKTWNRTHWNIESSYQDLHIGEGMRSFKLCSLLSGVTLKSPWINEFPDPLPCLPGAPTVAGGVWYYNWMWLSQL